MIETVAADIVEGSSVKPCSQRGKDSSKQDWGTDTAKQSAVRLSEYRQTLQELDDLEISTQAAGLIHLRRLIERSDCETMNEADTVLSIVRKILENSDPYIYSTAILALASLGNRRPALVLASVGYEYAVGIEYLGTETLTPTLRSKVGEVLVKMTTTLGNCCFIL